MAFLRMFFRDKNLNIALTEPCIFLVLKGASNAGKYLKFVVINVQKS